MVRSLEAKEEMQRKSGQLGRENQYKKPELLVTKIAAAGYASSISTLTGGEALRIKWQQVFPVYVSLKANAENAA
jgi:hypothetical protein